MKQHADSVDFLANPSWLGSFSNEIETTRFEFQTSEFMIYKHKFRLPELNLINSMENEQLSTTTHHPN